MFTFILSLFSIRWKQKRHIDHKLRVTQKKIWDIEFLRLNLRQQREGMRMEHDRIKETVDATNVRMEAEKKKEDSDKTILANLEALKKRSEPDIKQLQEQMNGMEQQIEGKGGINETIQGYRSVSQLLREYRKQA